MAYEKSDYVKDGLMDNSILMFQVQELFQKYLCTFITFDTYHIIFMI